MATTKKQQIGDKGISLWKQNDMRSFSINDYSEEVTNTEKIIICGESNSGKSSFYFSISSYEKAQGIPPEKFLMCIIFPDRPTGVTKLINMIPKAYRNQIFIYPIDKYEDLVTATSTVEKRLKEHYQKTGHHGWMVNELLEESWKASQDYYSRLAYGENLGEYFAQKRAEVKAMKSDDSAYKSLTGWGDWAVIKYFHNFNWIDRIKRMPFNVLFTAEIKEEGNKDSIFYDLGYRPAGEKDNMHRVDTILHLSHKRNEFTMQPFKLTGFTKLYRETRITGKNAYAVHRRALDLLEEKGLKTGIFEEIESSADIKPPKKPKKKQKPKESSKEQDDDIDFDDI
jgi:hypothetical protein